MKSHQKRILILSLGMLLALIPLNYSNLNYITENSTKNTLNYENLNISAHAVHIDNDWNVAKGAGICTGNGTFSDPYVIKDLIIDGGGGGTCIFIENSYVYFRIENCTVYNSGENAVDAGIKLSNVDNGTIINNIVSLCGNNGILIEHCDNNSIEGNRVDYNKFGIYLKYSKNNILSENTANYNYYYGISLYYSNEITLLGNIAISNNYFGINLEHSSGNNVSGNIVSYNNYFHWSSGIHLASTINNNVSRNTADHNHYGIYLINSNYSIIRLNLIEENDIGIYIHFCYFNEVSDNIFNGNDVDVQEYVSPKVIFRDFITIFIIITTSVFSGLVFITLIISRKRAAKIAGIKWPGLSRILAIISSILCLVGSFFYLWLAPDLQYFSPMFAMLFGILVIIGAFIGLNPKLSVSLICLLFGLVSLLYIFSALSFYGSMFIIIGSTFGLIGVYLKKKKVYSLENDVHFKHKS